MRRLWDLPLRAPKSTLIVMILITAFFGYFARSIRIDGSVENLLPSDDPDKLYYDEIQKTFGDEGITIIGVFAPDVFAPATLAKIDQLSTRVAAVEGVREVLSLTTVKGIEMTDFGLSAGRLMRALPQTAEDAAEFRGRVLANPLYIRNLVAPEGTGAAISVIYEPMTDDQFRARGIEQQLRALVAEFQGPEEFALTGLPTIKVNSVTLMESDTEKFTPLSMLLVIVVLGFAFRTVRGVLIPLSTVIIGVVWTTGFMVLTGSAINMGTLVLNPLLMVIGVASGIHLISEYYLEFKPGHSNVEIVRESLDRVRMPIIIAAATTLIGFGSLIFTPIRAVREFGIFSVFGIAAIVIAAFMVVPAVLVLLPLPTRRAMSSEDDGGWLAGALRAIGSFSVRYRWYILVVSGVAVVLAGWGIARIRVETDYLKFFDARSTVRTDNERIATHLAGTQPIYVVVEGDTPNAVTRLPVLQAIVELQQFLMQQPGVDTTMSLVDYLALVRRTLDPEAITRLPKGQNEIDQILLLVDPADVQAVINRDATRANIIVRTRLSGSIEVGEFVQRINAYAAEHMPRGVRVRPTGTVVLLSQSADALAWGQITGLWQELTVLLLLLSFMFLSVRIGFLALIPNVVPTIILYGLMGWMEIPLNISTSMIAAIAIGIAIDDTIHLLSTFNSELRRTGSQEQAVINAMGSVGQSAFFIALALSAGFFVVCLSNFEPVRYFGLLSGMTMGIALVVELFLTPALVTTTKIITLWDLLFLKLGPEPHKQIPLFAGLRGFQTKLVVLMGHLESVKAGTFITRRGEVKEELYVVLSGRAEVRREERVVRTLGRGDVVGEMGLVRHQARSADVVAADTVEYLVLDDHFLLRIRRRYPRIAATVFLNMTRILSDRLEGTTDALAAADRRHQETSPGAQ